MNPPDAPSNDGSNTWHLLQTVIQPSRANIVADVVGHPAGAPSVDELSKTNPGLKKDTVRGHLSMLKDAEVVEELVVPVGERTRGYPYKFYRLTERARRVFDTNGLFPETAWKRQYARLEKDAKLRELEAMPRPTSNEESDDDRSEKVTAE